MAVDIIRTWALDVMKIFLLFYMCHFAMGLTHCYKTIVFFTFFPLETMQANNRKSQKTKVRKSVRYLKVVRKQAVRLKKVKYNV